MTEHAVVIVGGGPTNTHGPSPIVQRHYTVEPLWYDG